MSLNRYRMPGTLLLEIRTTTDRQQWLSRLTRHQIAYCLGYASAQVGTVVHGAIVHGDTAMVLATDTSGLFSRFTNRFHTALTELANSAHKRKSGTIWDNKKPHESIVLGWAPRSSRSASSPSAPQRLPEVRTQTTAQATSGRSSGAA